MTRRVAMLLGAAALVACATSRAEAQCSGASATAVTVTGTGSCSTTGTILTTMAIPRLGAIVSMSPLSGTTFPFGSASVADYDAGSRDLAATIEVQANRPFDIRLTGLTGTWAATNDAIYGSGAAVAWSSKPVGDFAVATASGGPYTSLSGSTLTVLSPAAGSYIGASVLSAYFRVFLDYASDTPGSYTLNNIQVTLYLR